MRLRTMVGSGAALAALVLLSPVSALAQTSQPSGRIVDTSSVQPNGDRVLQLSVDVPAKPEEVYARWTTAEGWKSFAVRHAVLDFRVGGIIETSYAPSFTPGSRENIRNEIVAYVPGRMLAIRNVQAPPGFQNAEAFGRTATVIEVAPNGTGTRVTLTGTGFRPGPEFDDLLAKFRAGNAYTLEKLAESFGGRAN